MDARFVTQVKDKTEKLLGSLGVDVEVVVELEEDLVRIDLSPRDENDSLGNLIGYHGATMNSLQLILGLMVNQGQEKWLRVLVDVDGYRHRREEMLKSMVSRTVEKVRFLREEVAMPPMNSYERRIVHMAAGEYPDISSESVGEDPRRRVIIRLN